MKSMLTNPNYYDTYPVISHDKNNSKTIEKLELWYDDDIGKKEYIGTILTEERTWENFLETKYKSSQGIVQICQELSDGTRVVKKYDAVSEIYECYHFDHVGTLLRKEVQDKYGHYEISERQPDGSMNVTKGASVFKRMLPID